MALGLGHTPGYRSMSKKLATMRRKFVKKVKKLRRKVRTLNSRQRFSHTKILIRIHA